MKHRILKSLVLCLFALTACSNPPDSSGPKKENVASTDQQLAVEKNKSSATDEEVAKTVQSLIESAKNGNIDELETLIKEGANVDGSIKYDKTALMEAAWAGQTESVKLLIEAGADLNRSSDSSKGSALYGAAWEGHPDVVRMLLENGADVNAITQSQNTALWGAAFRGNLEIVKILLEARADVNKKSFHDSPLSAACRSNSVDIVKLLLEKGADPNLRDKYGATALHYAGDVETVQALLNAGANPAAVDGKGKTPLMNAEEKGLDEVVELLKTAKIPEKPKFHSFNME